MMFESLLVLLDIVSVPQEEEEYLVGRWQPLSLETCKQATPT